jgi:hypothetical protein
MLSIIVGLGIALSAADFLVTTPAEESGLLGLLFPGT